MMDGKPPKLEAPPPNDAGNPRHDSAHESGAANQGLHSTEFLLSCSFFEHARDNRPRPWEGTWGTLKAALGHPRPPTPGNPGGDPKRSMPALCAATFQAGALRSRIGVRAVHLLILDCDNVRPVPTGELHPTGRPVTRKEPIPDPVTPEDIQAAFQANGVDAIGWTTYSSSHDLVKHRWATPLSRPVESAELWPRVAEALLDELGLAPFRRGFDLGVLHNPAALAFMPGSLDPTSIRWFTTAGRPVPVPDLEALPALPAPVLEPWQVEEQERRKADRAAGEYWWQAYRVDGRPVEFRGLDLEPIFKARGLTVGPERSTPNGGTKRRVHCPWASEHSGGEDDDSAVIWHSAGGWPGFHCAHTHHGHLGLEDVIGWAWGKP